MKRLINAVFHNWVWTVFSIFISALLIRVGFVLVLQDGFYFPDSLFYSNAAASLLSSGELGEAYNRPPGYPVFLAAIYCFFGESIIAIRLVESVMGALLAVVIALIGRRIGSETVGALAGLLWAIYPLGVFITGLVYPTNLLTTLLACGILCFLPGSHQQLSPKRLFAAGVLLGLAALTKPVSLATLGVIGIWTICRGRRRRPLAVFFLFLGSAMTIVPWMIRDYYAYGRVVVVEPRVVEHLPHIRSAEKSIRDNKFKAILQNPVKYVSRVAREFLYFWKPYPDRITMAKPGVRGEWNERDPRVVRETIFTTNNLIYAVSILSTGPIFIFALFGTVAMWFEQERRRDLALLWGTILSFAVTYSFFTSQMRFRIPIDPYIIVLSAYGLEKTWHLIAARFVPGMLSAKANPRFEGAHGSQFEAKETH